MDEAARFARLLREAISSGTSGCVVWRDERLERRVRSDRDLQGMTLNGIEDELYGFVCGGGVIRQRQETRDNWRGEHDYVYEVAIPIDGFPRDLFVELVLSDPVDEACPVAIIVNAHLSSFDRRNR